MHNAIVWSLCTSLNSQTHGIFILIETGNFIISSGLFSITLMIGLKLSLSDKDPPPDARCGAVCSRCSSFLKQHCPSCAYGPQTVRLSCPLYVCAEKKDTLCTECPEFFHCPIYRTHKKTCPFENATVLADTLPAGGYLIHEQTPDASLTAFSDRIARGDMALLILRQSPDILSEWPYVEKIPVLCLQQTIPQDNSLDPTNLAKLHLTIQEFFKTAPRATVLLEGLEYLIVHNGIDRIVKFLHSITACTKEYSSRFITLIDPRVLHRDELDLIEAELKIIQFQ